MVGAVVPDPGFAENLATKSTGEILAASGRILGKLGVFALDLKSMGRSAQAHDRSSAFQIVHDVLHLLVGEILKAKKRHHQIRPLQCLESSDVRTARLDETGLRIDGEKD